jgi:hypothetical protein
MPRVADRAAFGSPVVPLDCRCKEVGIARDEARAQLGIERVEAKPGSERAIERFCALDRTAERVRARTRVEVRQRALPLFAELGVRDRAHRLGDRDAVRERVAAQVVVDQRGDRADLREPELRDRELGAVADQERHDVAARDPDRLRPVGDAIRRGVELVVAQRAIALD